MQEQSCRYLIGADIRPSPKTRYPRAQNPISGSGYPVPPLLVCTSGGDSGAKNPGARSPENVSSEYILWLHFKDRHIGFSGGPNELKTVFFFGDYIENL